MKSTWKVHHTCSRVAYRKRRSMIMVFRVRPRNGVLVSQNSYTISCGLSVTGYTIYVEINPDICRAPAGALQISFSKRYVPE